jgi:polysaccharide export outer membrane protein
MINRLLFFIAIALVFSSCVSKKNIIYFQNISNLPDRGSVNYEPRLKADDQLMIIVSAPDPEVVKDFNLAAIPLMNPSVSNMNIASSQLQYQTYLIDHSGNINFPVLGTVKLGGLTRAEAIEKLLKELKAYVKEPIVNLRILNFKVSLLGELTRPGTFNINSERITLPEALAMAGDMTIYGNRKKVLIIREIEGKKTHNYVDLTSSDFINSPFYYLTQNDVIYIEPNKTKVNSSVIGPNVTVAISALSLVITIIALAIR